MTDETKSSRPPEPIDFYTFCLSLGSSAFVHLGDAPHPESGESRRRTSCSPSRPSTSSGCCRRRRRGT